jgi:hypothetical protein
MIITLGVLSLAVATDAEAAGRMGGSHFGMEAKGVGGSMNPGGHIGSPPPMGGLPGSTVNHDLDGVRVKYDIGEMRTPPVHRNVPGETMPGMGCTAATQSVSGC